MLRTGERRTLAQLGSSPDHDLPVGKWFFSSRTLAWSAAEFELAPACDLFVVDELGPLEFRRGLGWIQALWALRNGQFRYGLVVIRPDLLQHARAVLPVLGVIGMPDTVLLRDPLDWLLSLR